MKLKNKMIVICLIFFMLISISAVTAADNNSDIITTNNNGENILSVNDLNDKEILSTTSGNFADLNVTINGDSSTDIELDRDYTYSDSDTIKDGIIINKDNLIIDGKGHTIDAKGQSRIFYVNSTTVYLKNIKFINGNADDGGAIYGYGDNLRVINCTFINNNASWGGAVFSYPDSLAVFANSTFKDNKGKYGGALSLYYGFRQNVINCTFDSNVASSYGGGVFVYGKQATTERPYADQVRIDGSKFTGNKAAYGDAVSNYYNAYVNITNSILLGDLDNIIDADTYFFYADYNWFGNTYDNKSVRPNISKYVAMNKWLYLDIIPHIEESCADISINNVYDDETGETSTYSTSRLPQITVDVKTVNATVNVDKLDLGDDGISGINFNILGNFEINASYESVSVSKKLKCGSFTQLQGLISNANDGDRIVLDKDYVYIKDVDYITQGILIQNQHNLVIDGNGHTINANGKSRIFRTDKESFGITFMNINIVNGKVTGNPGAGAYVTSDRTRFINCTFTDNVADSDSGGSALYGVATDCSVSDCKFINNTHLFSTAGAIHWRGEGFTITHTLFENNSAYGYAGAVYLYDGGDVVDCTFKHNVADYAGAVFNYGHINIDNCTFIENIANTDEYYEGGGAIYATNATITRSVFMYNQAKMGAAIFAESPSAVVDECIFINNTLTGYNGIIYWASQGGTVSNSIFLNNKVNYGFIISSSFLGLKADYNWFGNTWNNYKSAPDVTNLATMSKWLVLNATDVIYNATDGSLKTSFTFLEYDNKTDSLIHYDISELPQINLALTSQNLTLNKNVVNLGEDVNGTATDYKGSITAEYENVRYTIPFISKEKTSIDVEPIINVIKGESKGFIFIVNPFDDSYMPFLIRSGNVKFIINDSSIIKIDEHGWIKTLKVGTAKVDIVFNGMDVLGRDKYYPSNTTTIINVTRIPTKISMVYDMEHINVGDTGNVIARLDDYKDRYVSGSLNYINNNATVINLAVNTFKALKEGIGNITIVFGGNANYEPCTYDLTFDVGRRTTHVNVAENEISLMVGNVYYLAPTVTGVQGETLNCTSNDTDVAIIDENGMITAVGSGTAKLTLKFEGNDKYQPAEAYVIVKVSSIATHIDVEPYFELNVTDGVSINAHLKDSDNQTVYQKIVYTSNDTSVATVDDGGNIVAVGTGTANITVEFKGFGQYDPSKANVIVYVDTVINNIHVEPEMILNVGQYSYINATMDYGNANVLEFICNDTNVVTIWNKTGRMLPLSEGVAKIIVIYKGNGKYLPCNATAVVKVQKGATSITAPDEITLHVDDVSNLNANLTSIWENKNFTGLVYESSNNRIVKVDKYSGKITALRLGQVNVTIIYAGSNKYQNASKTVLVTVDHVPTTIEVGKTFSLLIDENDTVVATLNPSKAGTLNFTSGDESIVTVDENGLVTAVGVGQTNIIVSFNGDDKYAPASETVLVTVSGSAIPTTIEVNKTVEMYLYDMTDIGAVLTPENAAKLTYLSSNSNVVSVDENGTLTANAIGEANITVKFTGDGARFLDSTETVLIKVMAIPTAFTSDKSMTVNLTENQTIRYVFSHPEAGDIEFIIADPSIVSIKDGVLIADRIGKTNVTIRFAGNNNYLASNSTVAVEVVDVETEIEASDLSVYLTETVDVHAKLTPEVGKLTYTSSNSSIATVDENGVVKGVGVGEADIIVSFAGEGKYRQSNKTVHVKVMDIETTVIASDINVNVTEYKSIDAKLTPNVGKLTYVSSNSSIVTVNEYGVVRGICVGEADIVVSFAGDGKYRQSNKTVHVKVVDVETTIVAEDISVNVTESAIIDAKLTPKDGKLSYETTNSSVVSVDSHGRITGKMIGEADIIISFAGDGKYRQSNKTVHVKVTAVKTEIKTDDTLSLIIDEEYEMKAVLTPDVGELTYTSSNSSIVSVDENGNIVALKQGTAIITVSFAGEGKYLPSQANVTVNVSRIPTNIVIDESMELEVGVGTYLHPSCYPLVILKNMTYKSSDENIVEVQDKGFIFAASFGNAIITISYAGNDKYLPSNATVNMTVTPRLTHITAPESIEIGYGDSKDLGVKLVGPLDGKLTYESSNPDVVSIDSNVGLITGVHMGNAIITITYAGDKLYYPCNATVNVTVTTKTTEVKVDKSYFSLYVDDESDITAKLIGAPEDATLIYLSNNPGVVSVNQSGHIIAKSSGNAVITVRYNGNNAYHASSASVNVTVSKFSTRIVADKSFEMKYGENIDLHAIVTPGEGALVYTSSNNDVVSVNSKGIATAKGIGSTIITIKFEGDRKYLSSQKEVIVEVSKAPTSINIGDIEIYAGEDLKLKDVLSPSDAPSSSRYLTYESWDMEIFDVSPSGLISAFQEGSAVLYVEFKGNDYYLPSNETVTVNVIKRTLGDDDCKFDIKVSDDSGVAKFFLTVPNDVEGDFQVIVDGDVYFETVENGKATVTVDELKPGDHKVTMRYTGSEKYSSVTNTTTIHIYKIKIDKNTDIRVLYNDRAVYTVHLTRDTQAMEGKTVTFKFNGKTYYAKTNRLGYASIKLPKVSVKTYTITASYKGIKVSNKIISTKQVILANNVKTKKTKNAVVEVKLIKVNNKFLSGKKVTLKFNGKTYSGKTNSKGVIKFTIKKKDFSKLKVGKSYNFKVTYSKYSLTKKITITK